VHIASMGTLGGRQRAELSELIYQQSSRRHGGGPGKGRPPTKRLLVEQWIESKRVAGTLPKTQSAAMSQAVRHFESLGEKKRMSDETIRRALAKIYSPPAAIANPHK
jgi:hypothetical protein